MFRLSHPALRSFLLGLALAVPGACGAPSPPGLDGASVRAELACLAEERCASLPPWCDTLQEIRALGDAQACRLLVRVARDSVAAWAPAVPFPADESGDTDPPPRVRLRPRAPSIGWRLASPLPRGAAFVVLDGSIEKLVHHLGVGSPAGPRLIAFDIAKLVNYLMGLSALERDRRSEAREGANTEVADHGDATLVLIADERARWESVREIVAAASTRFVAHSPFERVTFARAAGLPSPHGDLARPIAIHDAIRIARAGVEPGPADASIYVAGDGTGGAGLITLGESGPLSFDALRNVVAARTGRIVLGAAPDAAMSLVMEALDVALAGRASRPIDSRPDVELVAER